MKRFLKVFMTLASVLLLAMILLYTLPQSKQVGPWFAKLLSKNNALNISFSHIEHHLSHKDTISLNNLTIKNTTGDVILSAQKVALSFNSLYDLFTLTTLQELNFKSIYIENGQIDLTQLSENRFIRSEILQLKNVRYTNNINGFNTKMSGLTAIISPWQSDFNDWLSKDNEFSVYVKKAEFSYLTHHHAQEATPALDDSLLNIHQYLGDRFEFDNVLVKGKHIDNIWYLNEVGLDWLNGTVSAKARLEDKRWQFEQLWIDNIQRDFNFELKDLSFLHQNDISLKDVSITHSTLSGINWAIEDIFLKAANMQILSGQLKKLPDNGSQKKASSFDLSASKFLLNDLVLHQLDLSTSVESNQWSINNFSTKFINGFITFNGLYDIHNNSLLIDKMLANDFNFTVSQLPKSLEIPLSLLNSLNDISLKSLQLRNISLQNTSKRLPWQLRELDLEGNTLKIKQNGQFGLFSGSIDGSMHAFSLNKMDFNQGVSFNLLANGEQLYFNQIKAANLTGFLDIPKLKITKGSPTTFAISLLGQNIPKSLFPNWHLSEVKLDSNHGDEVNFTLDAKGSFPDNFQLSSLITPNAEIEANTLSLSDYLNLSGELRITNTPKHGESNNRFTLFLQFDNGKLQSFKEEIAPSLLALKTQSQGSPELLNTLTPEQTFTLTKTAYSELNELLDLYKTLLSDKIDLNLNQLRTAPFFEETQSSEIIETR